MAEIVWLPPLKGKKSHSVSVMDAMQALVDWNRKEKPLYDLLRREDNASYDWFNEVISQFNLASTFPRKLRSETKAQKRISFLLNTFRNDERCTLDHVSVLAYELEPFTLYGKQKKPRNPLAAASQLMWFFNRDDIAIYEPQSRKGLSFLIKEEDLEFESETSLESVLDPEAAEVATDMNGDAIDIDFELEIALPFNLNSYYDYHQCWIDMYLDRAVEIHAICENLYELCDYEGMPGVYDYECLREEWFHRHVFAKWLYNLTATRP